MESPDKFIQVKKRGESSHIDPSFIPKEFIVQKATPKSRLNAVIEALIKDIKFIVYNIVVNPYLLCSLIIVLWVGCGILFYVYNDYWTPATAYFYAIEAGLSIGFCYPAEINDSSRVYTIFYVIIASSAVSGVVGLTLTILFSHRVHLVPAEHRWNAITWQNEFEETTVKSVCRYLWYHFKYFIGWYHNRFRTILTGLFLLWMAIGTVYGMLVEDFTFITALYWSITSCATGGLQSPPCRHDVNGDGTTCNMGDMRGAVMATYFLIGVPIYAITIAQYAIIFFGPLSIAQEQKLMDRPIEDAQFLFAANVLSPEGSETLVLGEYILLELLRLKLVDQERIEMLKRKFYELDIHRKEELDISDLQASGKIIPRKVHSIDMANRIRTRSLEFFTKHFGSPGKRRSGSGGVDYSSPPEPDSGENPIGSPRRQGSFGPRINSAQDFFALITGQRKESSGNIELPTVKKRRPTKRAFRKSIRKSVLEVSVQSTEEVEKLKREHLNNLSNMSSPLPSSPEDRARERLLAGVGSTGMKRTAAEEDKEEEIRRNNVTKKLYQLFDDFDYDEDDKKLHSNSNNEDDEIHSNFFDEEDEDEEQGRRGRGRSKPTEQQSIMSSLHHYGLNGGSEAETPLTQPTERRRGYYNANGRDLEGQSDKEYPLMPILPPIENRNRRKSSLELIFDRVSDSDDEENEKDDEWKAALNRSNMNSNNNNSHYMEAWEYEVGKGGDRNGLAPQQPPPEIGEEEEEEDYIPDNYPLPKNQPQEQHPPHSSHSHPGPAPPDQHHRYDHQHFDI
jgi:hypothetical protein